MKFIIVIFSTIYSLFACGYSLSLFSIDPNNSNIQMLLEKEMIHIEQIISKPDYIYERHNLKFGEKFIETTYPISFYAIIDKDIYCYDLKHSTIQLEIKKSGDGMFEPKENMINMNSYCFQNKEDLNSFLTLNKEDINKQKNKLFLEDIEEKLYNILPFLAFFILLAFILLFPVLLILFFIKKLKNIKV